MSVLGGVLLLVGGLVAWGAIALGVVLFVHGAQLQQARERVLTRAEPDVGQLDEDDEGDGDWK